jgi:predicted ATPase
MQDSLFRRVQNAGLVVCFNGDGHVTVVKNRYGTGGVFTLEEYNAELAKNADMDLRLMEVTIEERDRIMNGKY